MRLVVAALAAGIAALPASAQTVSEITHYSGMCDASAALALDASHFVVTNDEDNRLRVYERGKSEPRHPFELASFLEITKKDDDTGLLREADIEGVTRIGSRTYWIGSHARSTKGKERKERHRLFALDITIANGAVTYRPVGKPYTSLLQDMLATDSLKPFKLDEASQKRPEDDDGLNIEGLAASGERLLIAFRNPRPAGKALIVQLENPSEVVAGTAKPRFGQPIELDLKGNGIRSIEFVESRKAFVIVSGAHNDDRKFALYEWQGPPVTTVTPVGAIDFKDLAPEAQFSFGDQLYFLSDDGDVPIDGTKCKDLLKEPSRQKFRGFVVSK